MIKRYLKKPILVEAVCWDGENRREIERFARVKTIIHSDTRALVLCFPGDSQLMRLGDYLVDDMDSGMCIYTPEYFFGTYEVGDSVAK